MRKFNYCNIGNQLHNFVFVVKYCDIFNNAIIHSVENNFMSINLKHLVFLVCNWEMTNRFHTFVDVSWTETNKCVLLVAYIISFKKSLVIFVSREK